MPTMIFKIKRRSTGGTGAPSSLNQGELAYNEMDDTLWIGKGLTPTPYALGGFGNFLGLTTNQTVSGGVKTFGSGSNIDASAAGYVKVPTAGNATNDVTAASTAFVKNTSQPLNTLLSSIAAVSNGILVQSATGVASARSIATASSARITVTNADGTAGNPTLDLATVVTGATNTKITYDAYGRVTAGAALALTDLPSGTVTTTGTAQNITGAGLTYATSISQYTNTTQLATTAWVNAQGLGVGSAGGAITTYSTTPQTISNTLGGGLIRYTGSTPGSFTLPAANGGTLAGTIFVFQNAGTSTLTIVPGGAGPDTTDEAAGSSFTMAVGERVALICDGTSAWRTAWRTNVANPTFSGNVVVTGTFSAGAAGFSVDATGNTTVKSLTISTAQSQNSFLAGPSTGGSGSAAFRAIASADLPLGTVSVAGALIVGTGLSVTAGTVSANVVTVAGLSGTITAAALAGALTLLAPLASPTFTGTPAAPTASNGTNTTQIATTAYVLSVRLDQLVAPTGAVSWGSQRITNLADPVSAQDAATKNYVDNSVQGLQTKPTAFCATTTTLPANTYANGTAGVGATLTATSNAVLTIDGQTITTVGQVVLVKNEAAQANNGLYTVTQVGSASVPYILTRHLDMDAAAQFSGGFVPVEFGTVNNGALWLCNPSGAITVGTTAIPFVQLNKGTDLVAGNGISISGNTVAVTGTASRIDVSGGTVNISTSYVGQNTITTLGTITTGAWNATAIPTQYGGTGQNFSGSSGLVVLSSGTMSAVSTIAYTNLPLQGSTSTALSTAGGFGTMAAQNATAVTIAGGTIDGITLDAGLF